MVMHRVISIIVGLGLAAWSCSMLASSPFLNLESIYKANDSSELRAKLQEWHQKSKSISEDQWIFLPPSAKAAYEIYQAFFLPGTGGSDAKSRFVIVQKNLHITVRNTLKLTSGEASSDYIDPILFEYELKNLRPRLAAYKHQVLYLDDYAESQIYRFLATVPGPVRRHYSIRLDPQISREEQQSRYHFITRELVVHTGHWGDVMLTLPYVFEMTFDRALKHAVVRHGLRRQSGEMRFHKVQGSWKRLDERPAAPLRIN